jgi:hypothetical protein
MSREMKFDILLPFVVGMVSLTCIWGLLAFGAPECVLLFIPGIAYASFKLTPYLY